MNLATIFECLCDPTRLRILHLLSQGPLCVCHFQSVLKEPQVKISKHLRYLRMRGMVQTKRRANWIIYSLPAKPSHALSANMACLQECAEGEPVLRRDLARLRELAPEIAPCEFRKS